MPFPCLWVWCSLSKKLMPFHMPRLKLLGKALLISIAQAMHQHSEFPTRFKLGSRRKVSCDNSLLVKVAHLYRQILVNTLYAWLLVRYYSLYNKSQGLKRVSYVSVLMLNFKPVDVLLLVGISHNKIADCASKEHANHYSHHLSWSYRGKGQFISSEFLANPVD